MANFFKEYHAELRAKRQAETEQERKARNEERERNEYIDGLIIGQKIKFARFIDGITGKDIIEQGYFAGRVSDGYIWFADTKKEALKGFGWSLSVNYIIK